MVKLQINKYKAKIIDDAESTPGQSRQYDMFEAQVMPIFKPRPNCDFLAQWKSDFEKLDTDFQIDTIEDILGGVLAKFKLKENR